MSVKLDNSQQHPVPMGYILGLGRDVPYPKLAHLYKGTYDDPGLPMCKRGWNRDGGTSYSIWRGNVGEHGVCRICWRRAIAGKGGVEAVTPEDAERRRE